MDPSPPPAGACAGPEDVGKMHIDEQNDIFYECRFDPRRAIYTWVIVPPAD